MKKASEIKKILSEKKIDALILINSSTEKRDPNIAWLTQIDIEFCVLVIPMKKSAFLLAPGFEYPRAKQSSKIRGVIKIKKGELFSQIKKKLGKVSVIGINESMMSIEELKWVRNEFKKVKIKKFGKDLLSIRGIKTEREIKKLKIACKATDEVFSGILMNFRNFKTEQDIRDYMNIEFSKRGCENSFKPIVASGKNGSLPHAVPTNCKLKKGFLVLDFGAKYEGYHADMTRTLYLGTASKKEKEAYSDVLNVQKKCVKMAKKGVKCSELYDYAYGILGERFTHGLGHGIGMQIHELPNLKPGGNEILEDGMVVTIEPGIYVENKYGIRIEDDVLITKRGSKLLTKSERELIEIKI